MTRTSPERREARRVFARTVTELVHGISALREVEVLSTAFFGGRSTAAIPDGRVGQAPYSPREAASWLLLEGVVVGRL